MSRRHGDTIFVCMCVQVVRTNQFSVTRHKRLAKAMSGETGLPGMCWHSYTKWDLPLAFLIQGNSSECLWLLGMFSKSYREVLWPV